MSNCGNALANALIEGGLGLDVPGVAPGSVGSATPIRRHLGQRPWGTSAGNAAPQLGHRPVDGDGDGDSVIHPIPDSSVGGCYRRTPGDLKLDENLGERGCEILSLAGHDVATVAEQGMEAALDADLITACREESRAPVTLDLDFANPLRYRPSEYAGIAVLRLPRNATAADLGNLAETLAAGLKREELSGRLWIVEPGRIRMFQEEAAS